MANRNLPTCFGVLWCPGVMPALRIALMIDYRNGEVRKSHCGVRSNPSGQNRAARFWFYLQPIDRSMILGKIGTGFTARDSNRKPDFKGSQDAKFPNSEFA